MRLRRAKAMAVIAAAALLLPLTACNPADQEGGASDLGTHLSDQMGSESESQAGTDRTYSESQAEAGTGQDEGQVLMDRAIQTGSVKAASLKAVHQSPQKAFALKQTTRKVCQLLGETDRQTREKTVNQTASMYNLYGADLGSSFAFGDRIYFLFGDSWSGRDDSSFELNDLDPIAYSPGSTIGGSECIDLTFEASLESIPAADNGNEAKVAYRGIEIVGGDVGLGGFAVPTGGFGHGERMYIYYATDVIASGAVPGDVKLAPTRTVLAYRDQGKPKFSYAYDLSTCGREIQPLGSKPRAGFINVSPVLVDSSDVPDLPKQGKGLLLFASGCYRMSPVYLAYVHLEDIEKRMPAQAQQIVVLPMAQNDPGEKSSGDAQDGDYKLFIAGQGRFTPSNIYFFAGVDEKGKPIWNAQWKDHGKAAVPLFQVHDDQGKPFYDIGEISVAFDERTGMFYMVYQSQVDGGGIFFRYAPVNAPWNFSDPQKLYEPEADYGRFLHDPSLGDGLNDPGRDELAVVYGPYLIPQMFEYDAEKGIEKIFFTLSTWNPYTVVLMTGLLAFQ
jgi:hypothetical protein